MKFLKWWRRKKEIRETQLRIDHCRTTISEMESALVMEEIQPKLAKQFRRLEAALKSVDITELDDHDLEKIERATNQLLSEFRGLYLQGKLENLHHGHLH
jgi:hypothetical protein